MIESAEDISSSYSICSPTFFGIEQNEPKKTLIQLDHPSTIHRYLISDAKIRDGCNSIQVQQAVYFDGDDANCIDYSSSFILAHNESVCLIRNHVDSVEHLQEAIFFGAWALDNYYHFLMDFFSRILFWEAHFKTRTPFLVSEKIFSIPQLRTAIMGHLLPQQIILMKPGVEYAVQKLHYLTSLNWCPQNLTSTGRMSASLFRFDTSCLKLLRQKYLPPVSNTYPERIYLARRSTNRTFNEDDIEYILQQHGFTKVFMEDFSIEQQADIFRAAKIVVGPTGAAWTNLVFATCGTQALCWMAREFSEFSSFSTLAQQAGVNLMYLTYELGSNSTFNAYRKPYQIDPEQVLLAIKKILSKQKTDHD